MSSRSGRSAPARFSSRRRSLWARRMGEPGWVLLPLRAFLGITFVYAGVQKLADRSFFDAHSPSSVQAQMSAAARTSPIRGLLAGASHHAVLVGLLIALAELAVGIGALAGLWTRAAAIGGAVLSAGFLLAVSWHTRPFYYGADIVFLMGWLPLAIVGSGGVLSVDALLAERARRELALPHNGTVNVEFAAVRKLCGAYEQGSCRALRGDLCAPEPCPVLFAGPDLTPAAAGELTRRELLLRGRTAGMVAVGASVFATMAAAAGRLHSTKSAAASGTNLTFGRGVAPTTAPPTTTPSATAAPTTRPPVTSPPTTRPPGTPIGPASAVPVGGAARFTDPATRQPAVVVHPTAGQYKAFSAVCTHAGCIVGFSSSDNTFQCPCHGATFDASNGGVLVGPARAPLSSIKIAEGGDGMLYAV